MCRPERCPCGGRIALATGYVAEVTIDQEPFTSGVCEPPGGETFEPGYDTGNVTVHVCVDCWRLIDATVEAPAAEPEHPRILPPVAPDPYDNPTDAGPGNV